MIWTIGPLTLKPPLVLAPMAGCTDLPFRLLCREFGAGLCYSEMINAESLLHHPADHAALLATIPADQPLAIQLYGSDPVLMGEASALLSELPGNIIDINMGCPMQEVLKEGAGAALMNNLPLAKKIMTQVCRESRKPVTVKIRSGWNHETITAPRLARMAEDAGVQALAIHARTRSDGFSGEIDWGLVAEIKKMVAIPVIGNGELKNREEALAMQARTGCDGMMLGRAALGAPWIFSDRINPQPSMAFRIRTLRRHLALIEEQLGEKAELAKIRNHAWKYFRGATSAKSIRGRIEAAQRREDIHTLLNELELRYG